MALQTLPLADIADADARYERAFGALRKTILHIEAQRDRYEATLRKIAAWQGYRPSVSTSTKDGEPVSFLTRYEEGANDMLATLKQMAEGALS